MKIIFETPRLILREFDVTDAGMLLQLNSDPEVLKYLHEPLLQSTEEAAEIIRDIILPQYKKDLGRWAIHEKQNGNFIGWCGLKFRPELNEIDLGYRLIKSSWGSGFATEAAMHTLRYGFDALKLEIITARAHVNNRASINVLEKIGMKFIKEGIVDDCPVRVYESAR